MKLREKFKPCWIFLYDIGVVLNLFPERHGISAKKDMDDCDTPPEQGTFPVESICEEQSTGAHCTIWEGKCL